MSEKLFGHPNMKELESDWRTAVTEKDHTAMSKGELVSEILKLRNRIAHLERGLEEIEKHKHQFGGCEFEFSGNYTEEELRGVALGTQLGHECTAAIAKRYREEQG